jgi:hypothetical protein
MARVYHYECDEIMDSGWGCVYRSYMNLCMLTGQPVPNMEDMVSRVNNRPHSRWIEPAQLGQIVPQEGGVPQEYTLGLYTATPAAARNMQFTTPDQYTHRFSEPDAFLQWLRAKLPVVIDNGTFCFAIGRGEQLYDPHTTHPDHVISPIDLREFVRRSSLYMVFAFIN